MLLRFGHNVFEQEEYRQILRSELRLFAETHLKRCLKYGGWRDRDYREFQRHVIGLMLAEGDSYANVRRVLKLVKLLLLLR